MLGCEDSAHPRKARERPMPMWDPGSHVGAPELAGRGVGATDSCPVDDMAGNSDPVGSEGATVYPGGNWEAGGPPGPHTPVGIRSLGNCPPNPCSTTPSEQHSARPRAAFKGDGWPRHGDSRATGSASLRTGQERRFQGPRTHRNRDAAWGHLEGRESAVHSQLGPSILRTLCTQASWGNGPQ